MNATQIYTMTYKQKVQELTDDKVVSVGRVQTPTLKMIVDRANEIAKFDSVSQTCEFYECLC